MNTDDITIIICPECGNNFPASEAFHSHIQSEVKKVSLAKEAEIRSQYEAQLNAAVKANESELEEKAKEIANERLSEFKDNLIVERKKSSDLELQLIKSQTDLEAFRDTRDTDIELAASKAKAQAIKETSTQKNIEMRELQEENNKLKRNIDSLKTGSNSKSSQLLGEAGETYVENKLMALFPFDKVTEIKKGETGADCIWAINSAGGYQIAKVYCEAKNTQTFQSSWIPKLKNDMIERSVSIGILVTKTMPKDNEDFHFRDGVLVCNFFEFDTIAKVIRYHQMELYRQTSQGIAKGTKANQLFDYIISAEFAQSIEKILRPVFEQKKILEKEMRAIKTNWRVREKLIQESIDGAGYLAAGLQANLGADVTNKIGFEEFDLLEVSEKGGISNEN